MGVILQRRHATLLTVLAAAAFGAPSAAASAETGSGEPKLPVDPAGIANGVTSGLTGAIESAPEPVGGTVGALDPILNGTLDGGGVPGSGEGPPEGAPPPTPPAPEPGPTGVDPPAATGANSSTAAVNGSRGGTKDANAAGTTAAAADPSGSGASAGAPGEATAANSGAGAKNSAPEETAPRSDRPEDRGPLERIVTVMPWPVDVAIAVLVTLLAVMMIRSLRDRRRLAEAVQLARTDGLTGLANRQDLEIFLKRLAAASARSEHPFAVALVDLDHFKAINDDFGHQAGDATLRGVARALLSELREADHVGRLGGEEFLLILPDTGPHEALGVAERIRERIAAMPRRVDRQVTASVGVASMPGDAAGLDELMAAADRALYAAKRAGRDQVVWAGALDPAPGPAQPVAVPA
jgi:diguanylate cyclase (GGDEF)-like protein